MAFDSGQPMTQERVWQIYKLSPGATPNQKGRYEAYQKTINETTNGYYTLIKCAAGISQSITWQENRNEAILNVLQHTVKVLQSDAEKQKKDAMKFAEKKLFQMRNALLSWKIERLSKGCFYVRWDANIDEHRNRNMFCTLQANDCYTKDKPTKTCNHDPVWRATLIKLIKECDKIPDETWAKWNDEREEEYEKARRKDEEEQRQKELAQKKFQEEVDISFQNLLKTL